MGCDGTEKMKEDTAQRETDQNTLPQLVTWRRICSVLALVMDVF